MILCNLIYYNSILNNFSLYIYLSSTKENRGINFSRPFYSSYISSKFMESDQTSVVFFRGLRKENETRSCYVVINDAMIYECEESRRNIA